MADFRSRGGYRGSRGRYGPSNQVFYSRGRSSGRSRGRPYYGGGNNNNYASHGLHSGDTIPVHQRLRKDEDVQMNGDDSDRPSASSMAINKRFDPISSRHRRDNRYRGSNRGGGGNQNVVWTRGRGGNMTLLRTIASQVSQHIGFDNDWCRIMIPRGKNCGQDFLLNNLRSLSSESFEPINFHYDGPTAQFFVKGSKVGAALCDVSGRITLPDNSKLLVKMQRLNTRPSTIVTEEVVEKLKLCMSKRYDIPSCTLNLNNFFNDDDLQKANLPLDLQRPQVAERVVEIIAEHIPELKSLDLSDNRLTAVKQFALLGKSAPNLEQLNVKHNKLLNERELLCLGVSESLKDLSLEGNPLCDAIGTTQAYVSAIRKIFPKILRLDGQVLPPPITFDVDTPTKLPDAKGSQFGNEQIQGIICSFINWYYARYDSDDRLQLADVYHPQAIFSLSTHNYKFVGRNANWYDYQLQCRNLKWVKENQRQPRLAQSRPDVLATLCKLPQTQHSPVSFVVDVGASTQHMLTFSIRGLFKDKSLKPGKSSIRQFTRTFVTVPSTTEPGIAIVNEMLVLSCPSPSAMEKFDKSLEAASSAVTTTTSSTAGAGVSAAPGGAAVGVLAGLTDVQQQMIQQFSVQSSMNATWSARCLAENSWDYAKAAQNFVDLNAKQAIPAEAFLPS